MAIKDPNTELLNKALKIARMNCRHEFTADLVTDDCSVLFMQITYTCKKCDGYVRFDPDDKQLRYK